MVYIARGLYQMKGLDERINLVVLFWVWERRCGGGCRVKVAAARVKREGER